MKGATKTVIALSATAAVGLAAFCYFAPSPGKLRGRAGPLTITNSSAEHVPSSSPPVVTIPHSIQQLIFEDCGSFCGTDQIKIHLYPDRDFKSGFPAILEGEIGNPYWHLYTTWALPEPADQTFRFSVIVVVNRRPTYEIKLAVPRRVFDPSVRDPVALIVWFGPCGFLG